jgi:hypothetical protein
MTPSVADLNAIRFLFVPPFHLQLPEPATSVCNWVACGSFTTISRGKPNRLDLHILEVEIALVALTRTPEAHERATGTLAWFSQSIESRNLESRTHSGLELSDRAHGCLTCLGRFW